MRANVSVYSGICGYTTLIDADYDAASGQCQVSVNCTCKALEKFSENALKIFPRDENQWERSQVHSWFRESCPHTACLVPSAIIKAVQVASGLKVAEDAYIHFIEPKGKNCKGNYPVLRAE
jgi:hypothetical protein